MKHLLLVILCILLSGTLVAQMSSRNFIPNSPPVSPAPATPAPVAPPVPVVGTAGFDVAALPTFGLYGIGNTNTETFDNINASGKLAGYIRPFKGKIKGRNAFLDVNFAFNVNATNTDSVAVNTILFPDVGKNSFSGSIVFNLVSGINSNFYLISPFFEFSNKTISGRNDDAARRFFTVNTSFGVNFQYLYAAADDNVSFTISPYIASANVPDPGKKDYRYLLTGDENSVLRTTINSWGAKVTFQYNQFQIFADFRSVTGNKENLPVNGLKGFHPNIGIVFNANIFEK